MLLCLHVCLPSSSQVSEVVTSLADTSCNIIFGAVSSRARAGAGVGLMCCWQLGGRC
jgi:hypothetical protein